MTRWWISWASTPRSTARPCSSATAACCAIEASSSRSCWRERRRAVGDELADLPAAPAQRLAERVRVRAALGPGDRPVLEHERGARRRERVHRRLDDRLERLLEVQRLRDGLGDPRERLELVHPPLRLGVELRVLDRLRDLRRDREQQLDLVVRELARLAGADVQRALEPLAAREDRHGEDRLVLVLGQVGEVLEARVEVRLPRDRHRCARLGRPAGDALAGAHARSLRHLLDRRAVRRAQHELVDALVVEVDEARVGVERVGRRGRRRATSTSSRSSVELTASIVSVSSRRCRSGASIRLKRTLGAVDLSQWLIALHVTGAFLFLGGGVLAAAFNIAALRSERPSEIALFLGLTRIAVVMIAFGALLTLVLGFWLVSDQDYSFSELWLVLSLILWVARRAGWADRRDARPRHADAGRASSPPARTSPRPSCARACATRARWSSRTEAVSMLVVVLALMVWRPGA